MKDTTGIPQPPVPPKADPATLALRGSPRRVVRFRRSVIVGGSALASVVMLGVTWLGLQPATHIAGSAEMQAPTSETAGRTPDALAGTPSTYGDVPRLGPPLPGDLGRPILEQQREMAAAAHPKLGPDVSDGAASARDAEARRTAELLSARQSAVMMQRTAGAPVDARPAGIAEAIPASAPAQGSAQIPLDPARDPGGQQRKTDLVAAPQGDRNPFSIVEAPSPYTLSAGSILSASLITGLDSDLPGLVTAQVTENAYDSVTGKALLVPQGARLIGSYDSVVAFGQKRALVVWQRLLFPDGSSVRMENWPATDASGYAGLSDRIDLHTFQLLKGVALSSLLGVGTELGSQSESDLVEALRQSTQQNAARAGDQLVAKNLTVQPTLRVRPGWPLRVIVHKDLVLRPWH